MINKNTKIKLKLSIDLTRDRDQIKAGDLSIRDRDQIKAGDWSIKRQRSNENVRLIKQERKWDRDRDRDRFNMKATRRLQFQSLQEAAKNIFTCCVRIMPTPNPPKKQKKMHFRLEINSVSWVLLIGTILHLYRIFIHNIIFMKF